MTHHRPLLLLLVTALMAGCVPQMEPDIPEIGGQILYRGVPVEGALVLVSENFSAEPCQGVRTVATTDSNGHFFFKGSRSLRLAVIAGDPRPSWEACVSSKYGTQLLLRPFYRGLQESVPLGACDLSHSGPDALAEGVCSLGAWTPQAAPDNSSKSTPHRGAA